ncbi:ELMO domain-containing protein [Schistosoma japonicum]|nr:ELMO domain-containing protein [Schistosoma japonicum]KAH8870070.1 ELMO domain-containing protein [Schistosoma japonicum]
MSVLTLIFCYLFQIIYSFLRPVVKYIARILTGRCEISRIIANRSKGAPRTVGIENSLMNSKNKVIQKGLVLGKCTDVKSYMKLVISAKRIDLKNQPKYYQINKLTPVSLPTIFIVSSKSTLIRN